MVKQMTTITINEKKNVIVMSKATAKAASVFGTQEYKDLQEVRKAYPNFRVEVKKAPKRDNYKGLDYKFMKKYIEQHDDEEKTIMEEYNMLRGKDENGNTVSDAASYGEIRSWFLDMFPEVEEYHKKKEEVLARVRANRAAKRNQVA